MAVIVKQADASEEQWNKALRILRTCAENSLSYLAIEPDKTWFFSEIVDGLAAFAVSGHTMVICGDPVCRADELPVLLRELRQFAAHHRYRLVFLFALEKNLPYYQELKFGCYKSGEEAVFQVPTWSMAGGKCAKARANWHSAVHQGLTTGEYRPWEKRDPVIESQFREISDQWLNEKHTSRLQFAVGSLMLDRPCDKRYFYAIDKEGVIQGINVLNPYLSGRGWIVDIMRRREGCPHGVMDLLFHDIMETLKAEGCEQASLGIAPFFGTLDEEHPGFFEKAEHYIYENMNYMYGFKPLQEAKNKFNPAWENVYLVCSPRHMSLMMDEAAFAVLDSQGFGDYVRTFMEMQREKHQAEKKKHQKERI